jgi:hypothetical protein
VAGSESGGMSVTPEFGWPLIQPTDFVTDLPADFETFADAVDDDLKGLLGGTTGQVLAKDSATDNDFSWQTIAAGGLTEIASGSMAGVDNLLISSIPGTYIHLQLVLTSLQNDDTETIFLRFNDDSNANRYLETTTNDAEAAFTGDKIRVAGKTSLIRTDSPYMNCVVFIPNYANTTSWKISDSIAISESASVAGHVRFNRILGAWNQTDAISSLRLTHTRTGDTFTSGTYALYGVK